MSQVQPTASPVQAFKDRLLEAIQSKDRAALETLVADDFLFVHSDGRRVNKQQLINEITEPQAQFPLYRAVGGTFEAIAGGNAGRETGEARLSGTLFDVQVTGYFVYTLTYVREAADWMLASATLTRLDVEAEIEAYYAACMQATTMKDRAALERLFHEDYYLVDDKGNVLNREQMIDSVVHADTNFTNFVYQDRHRMHHQVVGDTIREVTEIKLTGKYNDPTTQAVHGVQGSYIYHATYVRGPDGGLRVIANTITNRV